MNLILCFPQLHFELLRPAVFHSVVQRFLQHLEEADSDVGRHEAELTVLVSPICGWSFLLLCERKIDSIYEVTQFRNAERLC
jgi:hypothetical protein